jgi:hypothetical protein
MKATQVKATDADAMTEKKRHVTKVQRKVVEKNITPQPARYTTEMTRKPNIGRRSSRRTETHPRHSQGTRT